MQILINGLVAGGCLVCFFVELISSKHSGWLWFFAISAVVNFGLALWGVTSL
ncbi:hypothetical protein LCGC14_2239170 [marine sediment metagenome]|uniref:Uncharacterized protein n=1 Tax=marine sediment metagenome TaxID=412755 RepID=A0A0F9D643_9ZZZZ